MLLITPKEAGAALMGLISSDHASLALCLEALDLVVFAQQPPTLPGSSTGAGGGAGGEQPAGAGIGSAGGGTEAAATIAAAEGGAAAAAAIAPMLLAAFRRLVERFPQDRGQLTVRLLLQAGQAHKVRVAGSWCSSLCGSSLSFEDPVSQGRRTG